MNNYLNGFIDELEKIAGDQSYVTSNTAKKATKKPS